MGRQDRARRSPRWALAGLGYALLIGAWLFASPLGAAPDEPAHMVRAAAAGQGQLQGWPVAPPRGTAGFAQTQADYVAQQTQSFTVPGRLVPPSTCFLASVDVSAACLYRSTAAPGKARTADLASYTTTASPFVYLLAGAAMRLKQASLPPGYAGRLALGLGCALLLMCAAWAVNGGGSLWPAMGLALAVTPMVLFLSASLTPAGIAVAGVICFTAALVARWTWPQRRGLIGLAALSAAVAILARPSSLLAVAVVGAALLPLLRRRLLSWSGGALALLPVAPAAAVSMFWAVTHEPAPPPGIPLTTAAWSVAGQSASVVSGLVGAFGTGDVRLPAVIPAVWAGLVLLSIGAALVVGLWRDRIALFVAAAATVLAAVLVYALVLAPVGWPLQGRTLLALAAPVPVLVGFALHRAGTITRGDGVVLGLIVVALQLAAFWENARRYAVGRHGPGEFLTVAAWVPPGGWLLWVAVAGTGCFLLVASLLPLSASERGQTNDGVRLRLDPELISVSR